MNSAIKYLNKWMWSDAFQNQEYTSERLFYYLEFLNLTFIFHKIIEQSLLIWEEIVFNNNLCKYDLDTVL